LINAMLTKTVIFQANKQNLDLSLTPCYFMVVPGDYSPLCQLAYVPVLECGVGRVIGMSASDAGNFMQLSGTYTCIPVIPQDATIHPLGSINVPAWDFTAVQGGSDSAILLMDNAVWSPPNGVGLMGVFPYFPVGRYNQDTTITFDPFVAQQKLANAVSIHYNCCGAGSNVMPGWVLTWASISQMVAMVVAEEGFPPTLNFAPNYIGDVAYAAQADVNMPGLPGQGLSKTARRKRALVERIRAECLKETRVPRLFQPQQVERRVVQQPKDPAWAQQPQRSELQRVRSRAARAERRRIAKTLGVPPGELVQLPTPSKLAVSFADLNLDAKEKKKYDSFETPAASLIESTLNPWSGVACIPDGSSNVSCFSLNINARLQTGLTGTATCIAVQFEPNNWFFSDTLSTANNYTLPAASNWNATPKAASILALYGKWRPVSMGLKINFTTSSNSDQGEVIIAQIGASTAPSTLNGGSSLNVQNFAAVKKVTGMREPLSITWRPEDIEDFSFVPFAANQTLATVGSLPWLFIGITGAAINTAVATVDISVNYEGYNLSTLLQVGDATRQRPVERDWFETLNGAVRAVSQIASVGARVAGFYPAGALTGATRASQLLIS